MKLDEVNKIEVVTGVSIGQLNVMEVRFLDNKKRRVGYKYINAEDLKVKGIIKKVNSFRKAESWLNTIEGRKWAVMEAKHTKFS
ncbi:hypothetical protein [Ectobacillus sp. sgz5001026]|uniref:hypothetical protein n=1 Tax=Ectobacillus sp. sgz5001026 TaxID=3242473 RepID=UPI0036D3CA54